MTLFHRIISLVAVLALLLTTSLPAQARFLSPDTWDPTLQGVDINRYAYALDDPINGSDPNGHFMGGPGLYELMQQDPAWRAEHDPGFTGVLALGGLMMGGVAAAEVGFVAGAARSVWSLPPVLRGQVVETISGANLPKNFPVIDRLLDGVATIIKSIDVTLKSAKNTGSFTNKIKGYIDKLADFKGTTWAGKPVYQGVQFNKKTIELMVDKSKLTSAQKGALKKLQEYAKQYGIKLDVKHKK